MLNINNQTFCNFDLKVHNKHEQKKKYVTLLKNVHACETEAFINEKACIGQLMPTQSAPERMLSSACSDVKQWSYRSTDTKILHLVFFCCNK